MKAPALFLAAWDVFPVLTALVAAFALFGVLVFVLSAACAVRVSLLHNRGRWNVYPKRINTNLILYKTMIIKHLIIAPRKGMILSCIISAVAFLSLSSCTEVETVGGRHDLAVAPVAGAVTKAPVTGSDFPEGREISLSAWEYASASAYEDVWFTGVTFARSADGNWHATPPKYWPLQGGLRFAAFSKENLGNTPTFPWRDDAENRAKAVISYVMPDNSSIQDDVLYCPLTAYNSTYGQPVGMLFRHALGQVAFAASSNVAYDAAGNAGIEITGITLKSMSHSGTMTVAEDGTLAWSGLGAAQTLAVPGISTYKVGTTSAAVGAGVMLPVQDFAGFTITYVFHNGVDGNVADGGTGAALNTEFTYDWTPASTTTLVAGQILKFDIAFTMNEIIVSPSLVDWDDTAPAVPVVIPEPVVDPDAMYNFIGTASGPFTMRILNASGGVDSSRVITPSEGVFKTVIGPLSNGQRFYFENSGGSNTNRIQTITKLPARLRDGSGTLEKTFYNCTNLESICTFDGSGVTSYNLFFGTSSGNSGKLTTVPLFDTSDAADFYGMFVRQGRLSDIPAFDTSSGELFRIMFKGTAITEFPDLDYTHAIDFAYIAEDCPDLRTVPDLEIGTAARASEQISIDMMFRNCPSLESVGTLSFGDLTRTTWHREKNTYRDAVMFPEYTTDPGVYGGMGFFCGPNNSVATTFPGLTSVGGFTNLDDVCNIYHAPNLTRESLLDIFNSLAVARTHIPGESNYNTSPTATSTFHWIVLHPDAWARLTDADVQIAINKGWKVFSGPTQITTGGAGGDESPAFRTWTDAEGWHLENLTTCGSAETAYDTGLKLFDGVSYPNGFHLTADFNVPADKLNLAGQMSYLSCKAESVSGWPGFTFRHTSGAGTTFEVSFKPAFASSPTATLKATGNHVEVIYDGTTVRVVMNGSSFDGSGAVPVHNYPLTIGGTYSSYDGTAGTWIINRFAEMTVTSLTVAQLEGALSEAPLSVRMVRSEMTRHPNALQLQGSNYWNYSNGLEFLSFLRVHEAYDADPDVDVSSVLTYVNSYFNTMVVAGGTTSGGCVASNAYASATNYQLDKLMPARNLFYLIEKTDTGDAKYENCLARFMDQLYNGETYAGQLHQRTAAGPFWHKQVYESQVWADGFYMYGPLRAEYAATRLSGAAQTAAFADLIDQVAVAAGKLYDSATGLYRHAWDESGAAPWIDPETDGQAYFCWSRGLGWLAMALVDMLEFIPAGQARRNEVVAILQSVLDGALSQRDGASGVWYNVLDCSDSRNYFESSGSCMFAYALMKAARLGLVSASYGTAGAAAYEAILDNFVTGSGENLTLTSTAKGGNPGGTASTKAAVLTEYFVSDRAPESNNWHGLGPFIMASVEYEKP